MLGLRHCKCFDFCGSFPQARPQTWLPKVTAILAIAALACAASAIPSRAADNIVDIVVMYTQSVEDSLFGDARKEQVSAYYDLLDSRLKQKMIEKYGDKLSAVRKRDKDKKYIQGPDGQIIGWDDKPLTVAEHEYNVSRVRPPRDEAFKSAYVRYYLTRLSEDIVQTLNTIVSDSKIANVRFELIGVRKNTEYKEFVGPLVGDFAARVAEAEKAIKSGDSFCPYSGDEPAYLICENFNRIGNLTGDRDQPHSETAAGQGREVLYTLANDFGADLVLAIVDVPLPVGRTIEQAQLFKYKPGKREKFLSPTAEGGLPLYSLLTVETLIKFQTTNVPNGLADASIFHEVGHNMGCGHTSVARLPVDHPDRVDLRPNAFGYVTPDEHQVGDVMNLNVDYAKSQALLYSGPESRYSIGNGGVVTVGSKEANCAAAIEENAKDITTIRTRRIERVQACPDASYITYGHPPMPLFFECYPGCAAGYKYDAARSWSTSSKGPVCTAPGHAEIVQPVGIPVMETTRPMKDANDTFIVGEDARAGKGWQ